MLKYIILSIIGLVEAFGTTINSKFRQKSNKLWSFITQLINIILWWYVICQVIDNVKNIPLVIVYAISYAIGDVLGLIFDSYLEKLAKLKYLKLKRKKKYSRKRKK